MRNLLEHVLLAKYPDDVVGELLDSYFNIKENFYLQRFKSSELEGGFFVECVRRIIEIELFNKVIPIGSNLNNLSDQEIRRYENAVGDESYRLHIPKALRSIYNLRNKRGVGHLSNISPNLIDSTYIVSTCDWILAEIIRLNSNLCPAKCQRLIDGLVEKKIPLIFDNGKVQRILDIQMSKKEQVLALLYHNSNVLSDTQLLEYIEYSNPSTFKSKILLDLHKQRLIEYCDGKCELTPLGIRSIEIKLKDI